MDVDLEAAVPVDKNKQKKKKQPKQCKQRVTWAMGVIIPVINKLTEIELKVVFTLLHQHKLLRTTHHEPPGSR